jgi:crossover junction endodeoxyribonuclease RuvC
VHRELPVAEYSPREVKRSVAGSGAASKQQVQYMVRAILRLEKTFSHLDASDALAIAICHAQHVTRPHNNFADWKAFVEQHPERIRRKT